MKEKKKYSEIEKGKKNQIIQRKLKERQKTSQIVKKKIILSLKNTDLFLLKRKIVGTLENKTSVTFQPP